MLNGLTRSLQARRNLAITGAGLELGFMVGLLVLARVVVVGLVFGAGYLANQYLMPVLPHGFSLKWYEVVGVLVAAIIGIVLMRTQFFEELKGGGDGVLMGVISVAAVLAFLYFTQDRPTPLAWEILTMVIAGFVALVLGVLGERLLKLIPAPLPKSRF